MMREINRERAAVLGQETVHILQAGSYLAPSGASVHIQDQLLRAVQRTQSYPPEFSVPAVRAGNASTHIAVVNESTLQAAYSLVLAGFRPVALNFASARHPGGGFLSGARAQEESLARSSGLYACLKDNPMYRLHEHARDPMYTDYMIYSPDVPVFRDDQGLLLEQPFSCAFLTAPAVNAKVVLERASSRKTDIRDTMSRRIHKVLAIAAAQSHDAVVLGAWGCGVFGNDPREIAHLFHGALAGPFLGLFSQVVFAILDWSSEKRFIGPFQQVFMGD
jgi:uncharacterized protein (TIGR02452 family)